MVKQNKIFCIDEEIVDRLKKETNASGLVNRLLKQYYEEKEFDNLTAEQLEQKIRIAEFKEKAEQQLKEEIAKMELELLR